MSLGSEIWRGDGSTALIQAMTQQLIGSSSSAYQVPRSCIIRSFSGSSSSFSGGSYFGAWPRDGMKTQVPGSEPSRRNGDHEKDPRGSWWVGPHRKAILFGTGQLVCTPEMQYLGKLHRQLRKREKYINWPTRIRCAVLWDSTSIRTQLWDSLLLLSCHVPLGKAVLQKTKNGNEEKKGKMYDMNTRHCEPIKLITLGRLGS
jgi:hypothetical protein